MDARAQDDLVGRWTGIRLFDGGTEGAIAAARGTEPVRAGVVPAVGKRVHGERGALRRRRKDEEQQ